MRWLVDPLDGTTNYLYGYRAFAVSIAAEVDGEVVAGVVADASNGEAVHRGPRRGARAATACPLRVDDQRRPRRPRSSAPASPISPIAARVRRRCSTAVLPAVRDIRRAGSAALDLCWVACGRLDAFYEKGLGPWDLAAGALIATEAGARAGDLDGGAPSTDFVLAAAPVAVRAARAPPSLAARTRRVDALDRPNPDISRFGRGRHPPAAAQRIKHRSPPTGGDRSEGDIRRADPTRPETRARHARRRRSASRSASVAPAALARRRRRAEPVPSAARVELPESVAQPGPRPIAADPVRRSRESSPPPHATR